MDKYFTIFLLFILPCCKGCVLDNEPEKDTRDWKTICQLRMDSLAKKKVGNLDYSVTHSAGPFNVANFEGTLLWNHNYQGADWTTNHPQCSGSRQTPINIEKKQVVKGYYPPMVFEDYNNFHPNLTMINNGHQVFLRGPWGKDGTDVPMMRGGPLNGEYKLLGVHCHWGYNASAGSEHIINGHPGALEMHFVHFNNQYADISEAVQADDPESLAVIGFIFKASHHTTIEAKPYFETMRQAAQGEAIFPPQVPLSLVKRWGQYYTYQGSLTTPECNEKVRWMVRAEILQVSHEALDVMKSFKSNGEPIEGNYRNIQPLNGRTVYRASVF